MNIPNLLSEVYLRQQRYRHLLGEFGHLALDRDARISAVHHQQQQQSRDRRLQLPSPTLSTSIDLRSLQCSHLDAMHDQPREFLEGRAYGTLVPPPPPYPRLSACQSSSAVVAEALIWDRTLMRSSSREKAFCGSNGNSCYFTLNRRQNDPSGPPPHPCVSGPSYSSSPSSSDPTGGGRRLASQSSTSLQNLESAAGHRFSSSALSPKSTSSPSRTFDYRWRTIVSSEQEFPPFY